MDVYIGNDRGCGGGQGTPRRAWVVSIMVTRQGMWGTRIDMSMVGSQTTASGTVHLISQGQRVRPISKATASFHQHHHVHPEWVCVAAAANLINIHIC